jgi:hypothetical protein
MNQQQQARRRAQRLNRALLTKAITKREYREINQGCKMILGGDLWDYHPGNRGSGYAPFLSNIRTLESDYIRKQRILDRDIDQLLGLKQPLKKPAWFDHNTAW